LAGTCPGMEITSRKAGDVELPIVRLAARSPNAKHRTLLFFGEHSRELISTESGLELTRQLCSSNPHENSHRVSKILADSEVLIFPNINLDGRRKVEAGHYCVRGNGRGVDLNRNWNEHWEGDKDIAAAKKIQSWGGSKPFSERETQILRDVATEFKPTVFLTVHSGTLGMYMPYAWN